MYNLSEEERQELNINTLPGDLYEAIKAMEPSQVIKKALGDHVFHSLLENKKLEWADYRAQLSDWDMKNYFPIL